MAYWPGTAATLAAIEDDWIIANGATLNKSLYPELFKSIGYTYGGSGDNFLIPYMIDKKYVRCNSSAGSTVSASIPNIKGTFIAQTPMNGSSTGYSGAFTPNMNSYSHINDYGSGPYSRNITFNASKSSGVYKNNATTVTPYSMDMIPIIKVK